MRNPRLFLPAVILVMLLVFWMKLPSAGLSWSQAKSAPPAVSVTMDDVDVWAGLSAPHREPKPSAQDRKRAEAKVCIALNAYYEARGESYEGQVAVGQVALRRAGLDYHHVCKEIWRPEQFSWTSGRPRAAALPTGDAWQWALAAADEALAWAARPEAHADHSRGATYFHARSVTPYWTRGLELVAMIDNHRFYR